MSKTPTTDCRLIYTESLSALDGNDKFEVVYATVARALEHKLNELTEENKHLKSEVERLSREPLGQWYNHDPYDPIIHSA